MFNPKENNLLDEQLAVSGLEMGIVITGAMAMAGVSAATSIIGGIMGAKSASSQNRKAREAQEAQEKYQAKIARITNKHNDKLDAADQANYYAMREYSHETNLRNWEHGKEIQDFQYAQQLKQFERSAAIADAQLGLNARGEALGFEAEQAAIEELFTQQQFQHRQSMDALKQTYVEQNINQQEQFVKLQGIRSRKEFGGLSFQNTVEQLMTQGALARETEMVKSLVAQGAAQASAQAGKVNVKSQQSNMAQLHRGLMTLESELSGTYKQAAIQMAELNADSSLQEAGVGLNVERIQAAINNAETDAKFNLDTMRESMKSAIRQSQRNIEQIRFEREVSDLNTNAGRMLFPERLPYDPEPVMPPERVFVDRMKAIPGFVPPAQQQSTWAPLIQGISGAASSLAKVDWGGGNTQQNNTPNTEPS